MTATPIAVPAVNIIVSSNEKKTVSNMSFKIQSWLGHSAFVIGSGFSKVGSSIFGAIQKTISVANLIASDSSSTANILRKLDHHVLRLIEYVKGSPGSLSKFQLFIRHNIAFVDFAQLGSDIHYLATGRLKEVYNDKGQLEKEKDNSIIIAGRTACFTANVGGALLWFNEIGFLSLSKAAEVIGEVRLFSAVPSIISSIPSVKDMPKLQSIAKTIGEFRAFSFIKHTSCLFITLRALDFMYAFFAIDAGRRLLNADSKVKAIAAGLDLSSYFAELTLSAVLLAGVTNVVGLGIAGTTCISLAASSFIYKAVHDKEVRQKA